MHAIPITMTKSIYYSLFSLWVVPPLCIVLKIFRSVPWEISLKYHNEGSFLMWKPSPLSLEFDRQPCSEKGEGEDILFPSESFHVLEFSVMLGSEMTQGTKSGISYSEIKWLFCQVQGRSQDHSTISPAHWQPWPWRTAMMMARSNFSCHLQHYILMKLCLFVLCIRNSYKLTRYLSCLCTLTLARTAIMHITHFLTTQNYFIKYEKIMLNFCFSPPTLPTIYWALRILFMVFNGYKHFLTFINSRGKLMYNLEEKREGKERRQTYLFTFNFRCRQTPWNKTYLMCWILSSNYNVEFQNKGTQSSNNVSREAEGWLRRGWRGHFLHWIHRSPRSALQLHRLRNWIHQIWREQGRPQAYSKWHVKKKNVKSLVNNESCDSHTE